MPNDDLLAAARLLAANFPLDLPIGEALRIASGEMTQASLLPEVSTEPQTVDPERTKGICRVFHEEWLRVRHFPYRFAPKDNAAAKRLAAYPEATLPEVKRRLGIALQDPFFLRTGNLAAFVQRWSNYADAAAWAPAAAPKNGTSFHRRDAAPPARKLREIVGQKDGKPIYKEV